MNGRKLIAMQAGGRLLAEIKQNLVQAVKPGVQLIELDQLADKLIQQTGGEPAFKKVPGYHHATCINVNAGVVHGIPSQYSIKPSDIVSIDVGLYYQGYYTDTSTTIAVPPISQTVKKFLQLGQKALQRAIAQAQPGQRIGHISQAIEKTLIPQGYDIFVELTGHGVGEKLHQEPMIPGRLTQPLNHTPLITVGQTLAIEVIYSLGKAEMVVDPQDGWTIFAKDGKITGLFEETVAVTDSGPVILTQME